MPTFLDTVNLIASLSSLILAVIAIWLALHFYDKSKDAEKQAEVNVGEIKTQTQALSDISNRMLDKYTDYATKPKAADETFLAVVQLLGQTTASNLSNYPTANNTGELRAYGVAMTIAAIYYTGLANLAIQDLLPQTKDMIAEDSNLPQILNSSREDFFALDTAIGQVDVNTINGSTVANLYQIAMGWKGNGLIRNMTELYPTPQA